MARQAWQRTITDAAGNVLTGVQITVFQENGVTLATIYGQQTGGAALANPFSTGLQTSAKFYADPGRYVVRAFKDGLTQEFTDVDISGKSVREDLGSAAYLVASAGVDDTTIGRAARIGDHGLGLDGNGMTRVTAVVDYSGAVDFNTITAPGWHRVLANGPISTNAPPVGGIATGYWTVHVLKYASSQIQQYAYTYLIGNTDPHLVYVRARYAGSWTPWQQAMTPPVGTVAFDATIGRSVGATIERGANSNGDFIKFADGTMLCTFTRTASLGMSNYSSGIHVGDFIWQFPAAFATGTTITISGTSADSVSRGWLSCSSLNATQALINCYSASPTNTGTYTTVMAVGRWR